MTTPAPTTPTVHIAEALVELKRRRDLAKRPSASTPATTAPVVDVVTITDPAAYVEAAVRRLVTELAAHPKGARNAAAHESARSVGRMVGAGLPLKPEQACRMLLGACHTNGLVADDGEAAAMASIRSGYAWGFEHPLNWTQGPSTTAPAGVPFTMPDERVTTAQALDAIAAYRDAEVEKERARRYARRTVDAEDEAGVASPPAGYTWAEFVALDFPDIAWVIDDLVPRGANVTVTAPYKTGKTTLVGELTVALAGGTDYLGKFGVHIEDDAGIAVWDYEMTPQQHQAWVRALDGHVTGTARERVYLRHLRGAKLKLDTDRGYAEAVEWLRRRNVKVWVLDPFARAYLGDENDNGAVTRWTDRLDQLKADADVHTLFMPVHTGRREAAPGGERARGATRLDDWPDVRWLLSKDDVGARFFRASGRDVELEELGLRLMADRRLKADMPNRDDASLERDVAKALTVLSPPGAGAGRSKTALREAIGCGGGKVIDGKVARLIAARRIVQIGEFYYAATAVGFAPDVTP